MFCFLEFWIFLFFGIVCFLKVIFEMKFWSDWERWVVVSKEDDVWFWFLGGIVIFFFILNEFLIIFEWWSDWEVECDKWIVFFEINFFLELLFIVELFICEWGDEMFWGRDVEVILGFVEVLVVVDKCGWRDEEVLKIFFERIIDFDGVIEFSLKDFVGNGIVFVVFDRGLFLVVFDWGFVMVFDDEVIFVVICFFKV